MSTRAAKTPRRTDRASSAPKAEWLTKLTSSRRARLAGGWLRRSWAGLLVFVICVGLALGAFLHPGIEKTDVRLHEGSVYVQNQNRSLVGSLNYQIDSIANATSVGDQRSTVLQEGNLVLINNAGSSTLQTYDPATNMLSSPTTPPTGAQLSLNNGVLAVTNPENGRVWFGPAAKQATSDFQGAANLDAGDFGEAIVTTSGAVIALNVQESKVIRPGGQNSDVPFAVDGGNTSAELTAAGENAIVFDRTSQQLWIEGEREPITVSGGSAARLPEPYASNKAGGRNAQAIYATEAGLIAIVDGKAKSLSGPMGATPIAPTIVGDCAYGAFGSRFVKVCNGGEPQITEIPDLRPGAELHFARNRDVVVLQDSVSGMVWLVDKGMKVVNNWDQVVPPEQKQENDPEPPDQRTHLPDRTKPNRPPVALDDPDLGARAGRATVLHVLDNDSDEDGDLLTITETSKVENGASLQTTGNGAGLQITLPDDARGSYRFSYTISDGRGGTASATATVAALPADQGASNRKPVNIRPGDSLIVNSGATASKRVLVNWRDPDGDDLVLVNAKPETDDSEDEVTFTPDGAVTFRDIGKTTGQKKVRIWVSDGTTEVEGVLIVDVRNRGAAPPIANGDFATAMSGREIVVAPLLNDEGNNLTLTEVSASTPTYTVAPNYPEGTFTFRSNTPGTYYLVYKVSNGPVSEGLVRIDVLAASGENQAPVAVRDVALLPFGGSVVVDPLLNDTDADNDVLVVQSVSSHPSLRVVMQERHLLTISAVHQSDKPIALNYWVSDGRNSTQGTIMVFPAPPAGSHAPVARNDLLKIRAGAVASVPVLRNDISPVGQALTLDRLPENPLGDAAWIDGDNVRVSIPANTPANTMTLSYEIVDAAGMRDSASITIMVISTDAQNEAPLPELIEARVLSDSETKIPINLLGIDPNGDSTRLLGLGSGPSLGRVTQIGDGWIRYQAYADSRGTDSFKYQVVDSFGAIGTGEIRVGVAPKTDNNSGPTAMPDELSVRPGATVTLPVLANDYDVDGDSFGFAPDRPIEMDGLTTEVQNGQFITLTAPNEAGDHVGTYYVQDSRGAQGNGYIYLHVTPDAPLQPPTARDDQLQINDILGKDWVEIDPLINDYDLDGPRSQLTVSLPDQPTQGEATATTDGAKVNVKVAHQMQQVRYQITDADGLTSQALLLVPGLNDSVPVVAEPGVSHDVIAGEVLTVSLDTFVLGTGGRTVRLTSADTVTATKGQVTIRPEAIDFRADARYVGPASVVFEVTDANGPDDPTGKRAFITVLINVLPAPDNPDAGKAPEDVSNRAPEGPSEVQLQVGAGEPAEDFPIRQQFSDPEGDNFNFENWQIDAPEGVHVSTNVGNDTITVAADLKSKGARATMRGQVFDVVGAKRDVGVAITVIGSTRPLPVAQPDSVDEANAGQSVTVPVLANDKSYLVDDQSLKLLSAGAVTGDVAVEVVGDQVKVTPNKGYVGQAVVRYTIVDATDDPDRQVDGVINLTVRAEPARPGTPSIEEVGNGFVRINWTSGSDNGAAITGRVVTASSEHGQSHTKTDCPTNTCTIDGLTNGVNWTFHVMESNELGDSEVSGESAPAMPDVKPDPVTGVSVSYPGAGNSGALHVSWNAGSSQGSPVTEYEVIPFGSNAQRVKVGADSTSATITGLTDGVGYQFQVIATNRTGEWSDPSEASNVEHPSGPPGPPTGVTLNDTDTKVGQALEAAWTAPTETSTDPVEKYVLTLTPQNGGAPVVVEAGTETHASVQGLNNKTPYVATVVATTRGGDSAPSEPSAATAPTGAPQGDTAGALKATAPGELTLTLDAGGNVDWDFARVVLKIGASEVSEPIDMKPGDSHVFAATRFGETYEAWVVPINTSQTGDKRGQWTQVGSANAFGKPTLDTPTVTGTDPTNDVSLSVKLAEANGTSDHAYSYRVGSGAWQSFDRGSSVRIPTGGRTQEVEFQICDRDHEGNCSTISKSVAPPLSASIASTSPTETKVQVNFNYLSGTAQCTVLGKSVSLDASNDTVVTISGTSAPDPTPGATPGATPAPITPPPTSGNVTCSFHKDQYQVAVS